MLQNNHCCKPMTEFIHDLRIPIGYSPIVREYYISLKNSKLAIQQLLYCPWCGTKLPNSLRDMYFDILEQEYHLEADLEPANNKDLPEEFKTDEWWKKRKISAQLENNNSEASRLLKIEID